MYKEWVLFLDEETTKNWYHLPGYRTSYRSVLRANGNTMVTEGVQDVENNGI